MILTKELKVKVYSFLHVCILDYYCTFLYGESFKHANTNIPIVGQAQLRIFSSEQKFQ